MCVLFTSALRSRVDSKTLTRNTRLIAEALTRVIYNLTEKVRPRPRPSPRRRPSRPSDSGSGPPVSTGNPPRHAGLHGADGKAGLGGGVGRRRWGLP